MSFFVPVGGGKRDPGASPTPRKDKRAAEAASREARVVRVLERAARAAARGDVVAEEREILAIFNEAARWDQTAGIFAAPNEWTNYVARQVDSMVGSKLRVGAEYLGGAGDIQVWSDRVLVYAENGQFHVLDGHVRASVETAGQLVESSRPTLTRMALGSVLPGSALLVGLALPKKQVHDSRELYFVIEHPEWIRVAQVLPDYEGAVRQLAARVGQAARAKAHAVEQARQRDEQTRADAGQATDIVSALERLAALLDKGLLTAEEFAAQKARLLDAA